MKLLLRSTPSASATWAQRQFAALTRWRLASDFCHGGIDVGGRLYHTNLAHGLSTDSYDPAKWLRIDLGPAADDRVLRLYAAMQGAPYDVLGVLGFGLPVRGSASKLYCFEWCAACLLMVPERWMTPEKLIAQALRLGGRMEDPA
jgi:hypothetical protein